MAGGLGYLLAENTGLPWRPITGYNAYTVSLLTQFGLESRCQWAFYLGE